MPDPANIKAPRARAGAKRAPIAAPVITPRVNPVRQARLRLGLTRPQFAAALGRSVSLISSLEGAQLTGLSEGLRAPIEALGLDFDTMKRLYSEQRQALASEVQRMVAANG